MTQNKFSYKRRRNEAYLSPVPQFWTDNEKAEWVISDRDVKFEICQWLTVSMRIWHILTISHLSVILVIVIFVDETRTIDCKVGMEMKKKVLIFILEKVFREKIDKEKDLTKEIIRICLKKKQVKRVIFYIVAGELVYGGLCVILGYGIARCSLKSKVR